MKINPLVSIIIPTKNSAEFLENCLKSIKKQTYKDVEIIAVDNNSIDNTVQIAKQYGAKTYSRGPERSAQTNLGIMKAQGKYIYRVDSDFILEKDVITEAVNKCEEGNFDGIAIHNTSAPNLGFWSDIRKLERNTYQDDTLIVGVRFYKKSAWINLGGYNEKMIWDDYDFHNRFISKGFTWSRIRSCEYHLGEPKSLWDIAKKSYFYGQEMMAYIVYNPERGIKQAFPIRCSYFRHWKSFLKSPLLTCGFIVMILVKYFSGMIGLMVGIMQNKKEIA